MALQLCYLPEETMQIGLAANAVSWTTLYAQQELPCVSPILIIPREDPHQKSSMLKPYLSLWQLCGIRDYCRITVCISDIDQSMVLPRGLTGHSSIVVIYICLSTGLYLFCFWRFIQKPSRLRTPKLAQTTFEVRGKSLLIIRQPSWISRSLRFKMSYLGLFRYFLWKFQVYQLEIWYTPQSWWGT